LACRVPLPPKGDLGTDESATTSNRKGRLGCGPARGPRPGATRPRG
jgi:hypothetical protein